MKTTHTYAIHRMGMATQLGLNSIYVQRKDHHPLKSRLARSTIVLVRLMRSAMLEMVLHREASIINTKFAVRNHDQNTIRAGRNLQEKLGNTH